MFKGKVVWITGASSGIGEAFARAFVSLGAKVILTARRRDRLDALAKELGPENAKSLPIDLEKYQEAKDWVAHANQCFGRIDVLVNNAGFSQRSIAESTPFELEKKMIDVDLLSPIALTKALLPQLIAQKNGRIIVTSSLMAYLELPGNSTYACVKHGLNGYFYSLGYELKRHGILVQVLEPGFVKTEISMSAMTASGQPHSKMDETHAKAMLPERFVARAMPRILAGKEEILIGGAERFAVWVKRFFPSLYRYLIKRLAHKVLKERVTY